MPTFEQVRLAVEDLEAAGLPATVRAVAAKTRGSFRDIRLLLKAVLDAEKDAELEDHCAARGTAVPPDSRRAPSARRLPARRDSPRPPLTLDDLRQAARRAAMHRQSMHLQMVLAHLQGDRRELQEGDLWAVLLDHVTDSDERALLVWRLGVLRHGQVAWVTGNEFPRLAVLWTRWVEDAVGHISEAERQEYERNLWAEMAHNRRAELARHRL